MCFSDLEVYNCTCFPNFLFPISIPPIGTIHGGFTEDFLRSSGTWVRETQQVPSP